MGLVIIVPIMSAVAVLFALWLARDVLARETGTPAMQTVADTIFEGAMAFLKRQYRTIAILSIVVAIVIGVVVAITATAVKDPLHAGSDVSAS
ncbi:MAG: sodium/proton-translocating pyrophosphatase, partial [Dehalococcoidia bacterium]